MTRDDFEAITSLDAVKSGRVRIELTPVGFIVFTRHGTQESARCIGYLEACQAKYPLVLFEHAIETVQRGAR